MEEGNKTRPEYSAPVVSKLDDSKYLYGGGLSPDCESGSSPGQHCYNGGTANLDSTYECSGGNVASITVSSTATY